LFTTIVRGGDGFIDGEERLESRNGYGNVKIVCSELKVARKECRRRAAIRSLKDIGETLDLRG
jgi:hypothetical protein